jgi:hypothetical protein
MKRTLSLTLLVALSAPLCADIAPNPLTTGGTNPTVQKGGAVPITMVWEEVDLYPSPEMNRVQAVFRLKNTSKKEVKLTVGFPSYFKVKLQEFKVEIDGKKQLAEVEKTGPLGPKKLFTYWLCWPMTFAAEAEHTIRVSYWCETDVGRSFLFSRTATGVEYRSVPEGVPPALRTRLGAYKSGYVLRTGAAWHGNIGKATIRLHYGEDLKRKNLTNLVPQKGWVHDDKTNRSTLVLEDFKPNEGSDIRYEFRLVNAKEETDLLLSALAKKQLGPEAMRYLLGLVEKDNTLELKPADRQARVVKLLEQMVPPGGPAYRPEKPDQQGYLTPGERFLSETFRRLLTHYRYEKDRAAELRLGREFVAYLRLLVRRKGAYLLDPKTKASFKGDRAYDVQLRLYNEIKAEYEEMAKWLEAAEAMK